MRLHDEGLGQQSLASPRVLHQAYTALSTESLIASPNPDLHVVTQPSKLQLQTRCSNSKSNSGRSGISSRTPSAQVRPSSRALVCFSGNLPRPQQNQIREGTGCISGVMAIPISGPASHAYVQARWSQQSIILLTPFTCSILRVVLRPRKCNEHEPCPNISDSSLSRASLDEPRVSPRVISYAHPGRNIAVEFPPLIPLK